MAGTPTGINALRAAETVSEILTELVKANARQRAWVWSLEYRNGKYLAVTRRPWVIENAYVVTEVTRKDVRMDDLVGLRAALDTVNEDIRRCCA